MTLSLFLLAHFIADFMLQNTAMANMKIKDRKVFLKHCLIYAAIISTVVIFYGTVLQILLFSVSIALSHFIVDIIRIEMQKRHPNSEQREFRRFIFDQLIHIVILMVASFFIPDKNFIGQFVSDISYTYLNIDPYAAVVITTAYVICLQPAGVFIKRIFLHLGYQKVDTEEEAKKSGFLIGVLERICILTLALLGQFTAISFVIAAKSLARIKQLEDKDFAEKYLVGTLLSVVIALICGIVVQKLLGI